MAKVITLFGEQPEVIRALTWKQPYASLMLHGKIETRNRPTNVRGKVLICAAKAPYTSHAVHNLSGGLHMRRIQQTLGLYEEPRGVAIAVAELVDCRPMTEQDEDLCFVAYKPNLWCWIFENVQAIEPFPFKGAQGWSILKPDTISQIKKQTVK